MSTVTLTPTGKGRWRLIQQDWVADFPAWKAAVKAADGAKFDWETKTWSVRAGADLTELAQLTTVVHDDGSPWTPTVRWEPPEGPILAGDTYLPAWLDADSLYDHQAEFLSAVYRGHRRLYLADEPGLGKTAQACKAIALVAPPKAVVVAPPVVLESWRREFERWAPQVEVVSVTGRKAAPIALDPSFCTTVILVGYSVVADRLDDILAVKPGALVLDEVHYAKDVHARRSQALLALADALPDDALRLGLSGTPMPAGPRDLAVQLEILGVLDAISPSKHEFEARYCGGRRETIRVRGGGTRTIWQADGATHLGELSEALAETCLVRRRKTDVLDLPDCTIADRPLPRTVLDADDRRAIAEAERDVVKVLRRRLADVLTVRRTRVPCWDDCLVAAGSVRGPDGISLTSGVRQAIGLAKIPAVMEIVEEVAGGGRPIVVMAHHRAVQERIAKEATAAGYSVGRIVGDQTQEARTAVVDAFQAGQTQVMVASITAGGVGITLHAASDIVVAELPWTEAVQGQAVARLHRIGQVNRVTAWRPLVLDTMDTDIAARIDARGRWAATVVDGAVTTDEAVQGETTWALAALLARSLKIPVPAPHEVPEPSPVRVPHEVDEWGEWEPVEAGRGVGIS